MRYTGLESPPFIMTITLTLPDDTTTALKVPAESLGSELCLAAAVKLFEIGRLSSGAAAELANLPKPLFLSKLAGYGVDTFHLTSEEIQRETRLA